MTTSRRSVLTAAGALGLSAAGPAGGGTFDDGWHQRVLERYAGFGDKASGGPGDDACGAWLEGELARAGYACERQRFETPYFTVRQATLTAGGARAEVIPQAVVVGTGPAGVRGPLRLAETPGPMDGAIAVVVLPYKRWSTSLDPQFRRRVLDALLRGAVACVAVTTGPTSEAIALNARPEVPAFGKPVAVLAPKDAEPFIAAALDGAPGVLTVDGEGGRRPAFNLIGRLDRGAAKTFILSTPRSGWFTCAGERGSGIAVWLSLALWAARALPRVNVELLATSGHEYEYLGGEKYLEHRHPMPAQTALWLHVGANAASRDWHEMGRLQPLPGADSQRVLMASPELVAPLRRAFKGLAGLEAAYPVDPASVAGELANVVKAGYAPAIGLFGTHRFHHARGDDLRCVSGDLVRPVADAFRRAVGQILG